MLYNLIPKRFRLSKIHERINIQCSVGADKQSRRRRPKTPSNQRLDFLDSFFFLAAGDLDLERLVREELRLVLPRERDLERRRLDADLLTSHREIRERTFLEQELFRAICQGTI